MANDPSPAPESPTADRLRWGLALGSAFVSSLVIEAVTGLMLMLNYSPSAASAWGSVYYINRQVDLGWFVRGLHRFNAYAIVILAVLSLVQATLAAAYRGRIVSWWIGLGLLLLSMVLGVTGNILPWDQRGYWAAVVETVIAGGAPVVGPYVQRLAVGGSTLGNLTLTKMYGLHVGLLPALFVGGLATHLALRKRHRLKAGEPAATSKQVFAGLVASTLALGAVVGVVLYFHGASLGAPADPASDDFPARPEWYFLWLFQLLKYFHGEREVIATVIVPGAIVTTLALIPLLDRVLPRGFVHSLATGFVFAVVGGAGYLTYEGWRDDAADSTYREGRAKAAEAAARAVQLASDPAVGIPPEGASYLLERDPLYRGGHLFASKCAGCHAFGGQVPETQSAGNLKDYGTRAWVRGLLEKPDAPAYFGKATECDGMTIWKESSKLTAKELDDVADFVATFAAIDTETSPADWAASAKDAGHPGRAPFYRECVDCHTMGNVSERGKKTQQSPDLFAWGSPRWTARMIKSPSHPSLYGYLEDEQKMPAFGDQLTGSDITALVRYLKGDYVPAKP